MSEKRFIDNGIEEIENQSFTDNLTGKTYWIDNGLDEIVDLLNFFHEENKELKQFIESYQELSENALITEADLCFGEICGTNGRQFSLELLLKTTYGGVGVTFNPMRLPQLLEQLGLEKFSELKGTYVQIMDTDLGEECKGIKSIMARDNEEWFMTENDIYFGSKFFNGYESVEF